MFMKVTQMMIWMNKEIKKVKIHTGRGLINYHLSILEYRAIMQVSMEIKVIYKIQDLEL